MKKIILITVAATFVIALSYVLFSGGSNLLQVNQAASNPSAYSGTVTVTGVMAGISPYDPSIFGMFDLKELRCKTPNCNKIYLPVKYRGVMPKPGDEVRVSGNFELLPGGYLFAASKIKVVKNHGQGAR